MFNFLLGIVFLAATPTLNVSVSKGRNAGMAVQLKVNKPNAGAKPVVHIETNDGRFFSSDPSMAGHTSVSVENQYGKLKVQGYLHNFMTESGSNVELTLPATVGARAKSVPVQVKTWTTFGRDSIGIEQNGRRDQASSTVRVPAKQVRSLIDSLRGAQ